MELGIVWPPTWLELARVGLRTFAALSRVALLRDGHADLSFAMTVWIGLVTVGNNHFGRKSFTWAASKVTWKKPQSHNFLAIRDQEMKMSNRFSGKLSIYPGQYIHRYSRKKNEYWWDWHLIVERGSRRLFVSKHSHIRWNTLLNLIVNFASTKTMGEFRTQNLWGNFISQCEKNKTKLWNRIMCTIASSLLYLNNQFLVFQQEKP